MIDCWLWTICGDKAAENAMRPSAIYNWAQRHSVWWTEIIRADADDLLIAVLNNVSMEAAKAMLV